MNFVVEKLKEAPIALKNMSIEALVWFDKALPPETRDHKINQWLPALKNSGGEVLAWFDKIFPPEIRADKINQCQLALKNLGGVALAWFDKVFPPETRADKIKHWLQISQPYLIAAMVLAVAFYFFRGGRGGGGSVKMMKAPGRNYRMPRQDFVSNPKDYFQNLRARK